MKKAKTKHLTYFALIEALEGEGCALCSLVLRSLERYFDSLVYEKVNRPAIRDAVRASQGFCAAHGEMLRQARSALGSAIIHRDLLNAVVQHLERERRVPNSPVDWLRALVQTEQPPQEMVLSRAGPCPACLHAHESEQNYVDTLLANWEDEALQEAFRRSPGLCISHLRMVLTRTTDPARFEAIKEIQLDIWRELLGELDEFIRKQDYRFSDESIGEERDSWSRAIHLVSGIWQVAGSRCR